MSNTELAASQSIEDTPFVQFWNEVLVPKFIRFKHILVGGLTRHSEEIFPTLPVREGDRVLDVGCGFGDTAIKLAELVGPDGEVVGMDCCDAFLEYARKDVEARGLTNVRFMRGDAELALPANEFDFVAGYDNIEFRRVDAPVLVGHDVKDAIDFQLAIGPAGEVFREAGAEAEEKRDLIEAALAKAINQQKTAAEGIVMDSSSWVISAINPEQ